MQRKQFTKEKKNKKKLKRKKKKRKKKKFLHVIGMLRFYFFFILFFLRKFFFYFLFAVCFKLLFQQIKESIWKTVLHSRQIPCTNAFFVLNKRSIACVRFLCTKKKHLIEGVSYATTLRYTTSNYTTISFCFHIYTYIKLN